MSGSPLVIRRRRLLIVGLVILFLLNIGNAVSVYALFVLDLDFAFGIVPLFNFDTESNFPTFFNGLLLGFASALLYVTGAIGFELLEAAHTEKHGMDSLGFGILYSIEETFEMLAVMMAVLGFMGYASEHCGELGARIVLAP